MERDLVIQSKWKIYILHLHWRFKRTEKKDETIFYYLDLNAFVSYKFYGRHSVLPEIYREPRKQISYPTHPHTYTRSRDISGMLDTLRFYLKL